MANEEDQASLELEETVQYSTPHAPTFTVHLSGGDVSAVGGVMTVTRAQERELDKLMRTRPDIRSHLVKIDMEAAAALVKAHMAAQQPAANQGAVTAGVKTLDTMREVREGQTAEALTGSSNPQPPPVQGGTPVPFTIIDDKQPVVTDAIKRPGILGRIAAGKATP